MERQTTESRKCVKGVAQLSVNFLTHFSYKHGEFEFIGTSLRKFVLIQETGFFEMIR